VETEEGGLPRIEVRVGGHAASTEPGRIVETILAALERQGAAGAMMAEQWREAATLRVVASEPHVTAAGKILPLHVTPRRGDPPAPQ
jgi:hypothetical protein